MTFGEKLRALMSERGMGLRELAALAPCDPGHLSKICHGHKHPSRRLAERLDEVLRADGALFEAWRPVAARRSPNLSPDHEERLLRAARRPGHTDLTVVESLASVLDAQRRAEDVIGAAPVIEPVRAQLVGITQMVIHARGAVRRQLLDVAAQWSQFAGWLYASLGRYDQALAQLRTTLEWSTEIGDDAMIGSVMSWRGYIAERRGEIGPMIGLSQAGQRLRDSAGRVYDLYQEARARALLGEAAMVDRLTALAAEEAVGLRPDAARPWEYYYFALGFFTMEHGLAYRILGRTDPDRNADAVELLARGLDELPTEMRGSEWAADFRYQLGRAYLQAGEHGEAARIADELDEAAHRLGSTRITQLAAALR